MKLIKKIKKDKINILTHCNAGWLATIDWGTATAPIYKARDANINVHTWVDETSLVIKDLHLLHMNY